MTLKPGLGVTQGHRNRHGSIWHYDFLLTFHSNHGPTSNRFRDKRRFQSKIAKFSQPRVFCAPAQGVTLELSIGARDRKTRMMGLSGREIILMISSAGWIQSTNVTDRQTVRRTDQRTDTGPQQRPPLHIASRGKNS